MTIHSSETTSVVLLPTRGIVIKPSSEGVHKAPESLIAAPEPSGVSAYKDREDVKQALEREFGPNHIMYWVAVNESALDPSAANPSGAKGLFQIVGTTWRGYGCTGDVFNAEDNIKCARKIYDRNGLRDWEWSRNHGSDGGWGKRLSTSTQ